MMATANGRRLRLAVGLILSCGALAQALTLDDHNEMRLGLRAYTNVRINTEASRGGDDPLSFPRSGVGHIRQHRYFLQLKFDHDLKRISQTYGWAWLLGGWMNPDEYSYSLQYRGEGEGIYDYGPTEWSSRTALENYRSDVPKNALLGLDPEVCNHNLRRKDGSVVNYCDERISKLRRLARQRHRLFAGYVDFTKGPVQLRIGRQVLAWGETDIFRLLDNINPLDASFGGFLLALDERRVPIDMVRASYRFGTIGPMDDAFLEGFVAQGNRVSQFPGTPNGSAWSPGGIANPNIQLRQIVEMPKSTDVRGGGRFVGNIGDASVSVAHYWTYFDTPTVRFTLPGQSTCNDADPNTPSISSTSPKYCNPIIAHVMNPRVPVSGASITFPVASLYSIVRGEFAYNYGEPMNRQGRGSSADANDAPGTKAYRRLAQEKNYVGGLDPFTYPGFLNLTRPKAFQGYGLRLDTINAALGLDVNRFIRWLNPNQTIFASGQIFYKHVLDSPGDLVLPTPYFNRAVDPNTLILGKNQVGCPTANGGKRNCRIRPRLFHLNDNQLTNTLLITSSYLGGQIVPSFAMLYDWQGAYAIQPGITFSRDPIRFTVDYSFIGGAPTGQIGNLRDRDNVRAQVEFVF